MSRVLNKIAGPGLVVATLALAFDHILKQYSRRQRRGEKLIPKKAAAEEFTVATKVLRAKL